MPLNTLPTSNRFALRLGSAHVAFVLPVAAGAVLSVFDWPKLPIGGGTDVLASASQLLFSIGLAYLLVTLLVHFRWGTLLRGGSFIGKGNALLASLGHTLVAVCAGWILLTGPASRTLLVSLDRLIAMLACISVFSLLLALGDWVATKWHERFRKLNGDMADSEFSVSIPLGWSLLVVATALAVAAAVIFLEQQSVIPKEITQSLSGEFFGEYS